ncbi:MAG: hypothetical protein Phog2KO_35860 [Phototrophicaceae bacterium]
MIWIGGQCIVYFLVNAIGSLVPLNGVPVVSFVRILANAIIGLAFGWFAGWVQQWSIHKHFGLYVEGWRTISAIMTGIILVISQLFIIWFIRNFVAIYQNPISYSIFWSLLYIVTLGAASIGQTILLRKHVQHSWLYLLSPLIAGITFGLPFLLGASSPLIAYLVHYIVSAFVIIWLFQMTANANIIPQNQLDTDYLVGSEYQDSVELDDSL